MVALNPTPAPRFALGEVVATPGALEALAAAGQDPSAFISRHVSGDWGEISAQDREVNDQAVMASDRILSAYKLKTGVTIWIVTEADRSSSCVLLPDEY